MALGSSATFARAIARRIFLFTAMTHPTTARFAASASGPHFISRSSSTRRGMFPDLPMEDDSASSSDGPTILDGRELSRRMRAAIKAQVEDFKEEHGYAPHLAIITVGERPPEEAQRRALFASGPGEASWFDKVKGAKEVGMDVTHIVMPGTASFEDVRGEIDRLARLWNVHGIMVEQPLPEHLKPFRLDIWRTIRPHKDVDGMHSANAGRLADFASGLGRLGEHRFPLEYNNLPTTALGAMQYLDMCKIAIKPGARVLVIGRSKLVGLPLALLLLGRDATVTIAHSKTPTEDLKAMCKEADVVVGAVGRPRLIEPDWIKKDAVVLNVGTTFVPEEKAMVGDVDKRGMGQVTDLLTPSPYVDAETGAVGPSGVGPLTLPMLLYSTLASALRQGRAAKHREKNKASIGVQPTTPVLTSNELRAALEGPGGLKESGWTLGRDEEGGHPVLRKTWLCRDFKEATNLVTEIRRIADRENHHPILSITRHKPEDGSIWCDNDMPSDLNVELSSAAVQDLTHFDITQARSLSALVCEAPGDRKYQGRD